MHLSKRLGTSRLHELHESKFPFISPIEFIRSKHSIFFCPCIRAQGSRAQPVRLMQLPGSVDAA